MSQLTRRDMLRIGTAGVVAGLVLRDVRRWGWHRDAW